MFFCEVEWSAFSAGRYKDKCKSENILSFWKERSRFGACKNFKDRLIRSLHFTLCIFNGNLWKNPGAFCGLKWKVQCLIFLHKCIILSIVYMLCPRKFKPLHSLILCSTAKLKLSTTLRKQFLSWQQILVSKINHMQWTLTLFYLTNDFLWAPYSA